MLANSQPRTVLGLIVRALVFEAGNGRMTALRIILQLLDRDREEAATAVTERISGETQCDWSADGAWRIRPDTKAMEAEPDGPPNSLSQGISQGISEKVAPGIKAAEQPRPMNREQRRRLAARARQRQKEEARSREFAEAA
ncbi:MAG TPA: hypothetical protein VHT03_12585 [Rhizomicrobium sp.]|nr:hypothetical protein [Rhizomicrobium sp.]